MKRRLRSVWTVAALCAFLAVPDGHAAERSPAPQKAAPAAIQTEGSIPRATFDRWLSRGPQYLLSQVVPTPVTRDRRFLGFQLSAWFPGHPDVPQGAMRLGDVVLRVNGRSVERPDQFLYVWKTLTGVATVVVEGTRDGAPLKATLTIVDEPVAPSAPETPAPTVDAPKP